MNREVREHIRSRLTDPAFRRDWEQLLGILGDPCLGCPADLQRADSPTEQPPCYECPFWDLRLDLARLELLRRLEGGSAPGTSDKA